MDAKFQHFVAHVPGVPKISQRKPPDSNIDSRPCPDVTQLLEPVAELPCLFDFNSDSIVTHRIHNSTITHLPMAAERDLPPFRVNEPSTRSPASVWNVPEGIVELADLRALLP